MKCSNFEFDRRRGLTLIEMLVAIGIVGVLSSLALYAVQRSREAARRAQCGNNLRQIGLALQAHHTEQNRFPAGIVWRAGQPMWLSSWSVKLYPYVEYEDLYREVLRDYQQLKAPIGGGAPHYGVSHPVPLFSCPSDGRADRARMARGQEYVALTNYLGVLGTDVQKENGILFADSAVRMKDIRDGSSRTVIVGERPPSADLWYGWLYTGFGFGRGSGDVVLGVQELNNQFDILSQCSRTRGSFGDTTLDEPCHILHFWSMHPGGAMFAFADGSVQFVSYGSATMIERAATRDDRPAGQ